MNYNIEWNVDWNIVLNFCTLIVTFYFTRQLVKNDNNRMEESKLEKIERRKRDIVSYCKNELFSSISSGSQGLYQSVGQSLAEKYPKDLFLILEAVEEILKQNGRSVTIDMLKFVNSMDMYDNKGIYNWTEVHRKFKNRFVD